MIGHRYLFFDPLLEGESVFLFFLSLVNENGAPNSLDPVA